MRDLEKYRGIIPAFYACYEDDGSVSPERTREFTRYLIDKGVKGLYVCGSSGECIYQSKEERTDTGKRHAGSKRQDYDHRPCRV